MGVRRRRSRRGLGMGAILMAVGLLAAPSAMANHPVLLEGNCNNAADPAFAPPAAATCGDYDGDGDIGTAEDNDGDRVFGTINGANTTGSATQRINNNGTITAVTSGLFAEAVSFTGNVTLEAAPGVELNVDAVRQGDPGSTARQSQTGISVNAPTNRQVVLRNIRVGNWRIGVDARGDSRLAMENVRIEHNVEFGMSAADNARVSMRDSEVFATGRRQSAPPGPDFPTPNAPGVARGISFQEASSGTVFDASVTGSVGIGVLDSSSGDVCLAQVNVFDNDGGNTRGTGSPGTSCIGSG